EHEGLAEVLSEVLGQGARVEVQWSDEPADAGQVRGDALHAALRAAAIRVSYQAEPPIPYGGLEGRQRPKSSRRAVLQLESGASDGAADEPGTAPPPPGVPQVSAPAEPPGQGPAAESAAGESDRGAGGTEGLGGQDPRSASASGAALQRLGPDTGPPGE